MRPVLSAEEVRAYLRSVFPQMEREGAALDIAAVGDGTVIMRLHAGETHLRPGGTVSGPSVFGLVDAAAYVVILAHVGPVGLAVTTSAQIDFLVRPAPGALSCEASLLKLGRRLAVVDARVRDEAGTLVARASLTYSLPPDWDAESPASVSGAAEAGG